jgi:tetratricopeptide (TPR) repeat protein
MQGRYAEAESLIERTLAINEKNLGAEHPATASSLNSLALLYYSQEHYAEAEMLLQRALRIFEKTLGAEHPNTQTVEASLIQLREKMQE